MTGRLRCGGGPGSTRGARGEGTGFEGGSDFGWACSGLGVSTFDCGGAAGNTRTPSGEGAGLGGSDLSCCCCFGGSALPGSGFGGPSFGCSGASASGDGVGLGGNSDFGSCCSDFCSGFNSGRVEITGRSGTLGGTEDL